MRKMMVWSLSGLSVVGLALGACHNGPGAREANAEGDRDGVNGEGQRPELGSGVSTHRAVDAIASARCEREERCENIGEGQNYSSMGACKEKIRADWSGDLNKYECPKGVNQAELDECLAGVRAEDCGNPFDTLSRVAACNSDDICDGD